jgi:PAS domain S-box-containing protein
MKDVKIILVEDEEIVANYIEKQLVSAGHHLIASVNNGDAAIEKVKSLNPDVVLMDIKLIGPMDGIETASLIRKNYQVPVIFLTSLTDDESFQHAKTAEPFGYLTKPIDINEFNRVVDIALFRNKIYKELLDTKLRFEIAIKAGNMGVWEFWPTEKKYFSDSNLKKLYGFDDHELSENLDDWSALVHIDDRDLMSETFSNFLKSNEQEFKLEHRIYKKDGSVAWVIDHGLLFQPDSSKPLRMIGTTIDITQRKEAEIELQKSEEKFRKIFENAGIGMVMVEPGGHFIKVNKAFCEIVGYNETEMLGKNFRDITHPDDLDKSVGLTNELLEDVYKETGAIEKRYFHKNGNIIWALTTLSLIRDSLGNPQFFITQIQDITNRKKYEEKLLMYADELKILNASKDKFFAIISHDLRTPFNSLLGISEFVTQSYEDMSREEIRESISSIYRSSQKVYNLILNLFEWTRLQSGRFEVEKTSINLFEKTGEIQNLYSQQAESKQINILNNISEEINVVADRYMLETILRNLISNAIKFTNKGGTVSVSAVRKGNFAEIAVKDNGVGISEENQKKLFRIDTKFQTDGTAYEAGTGLGLILCKEFVEENGGTIYCSSEEGKGTRFFFTLPLQTVSN